MYKCGIDLGGTKVEGVVLLNDQIFYSKRISTEANLGYSSILNKVCALYQELYMVVAGSPHTLGVGTPGSIMPKTGLLTNCNIAVMNGKSLRSDLEEKLQRTFELENDANCFVVAEGSKASDVSYRSVFGVVLGTGCGAGILVDNKLVVGASRLAGEWGHMSINIDGPPCYCGRKGCVERYVSGKGLQEEYERLTSTKASLEMIMTRYREGGVLERPLIERFMTNLAFSLANVISILDPEVIIIGGGLSQVHEIFDFVPLQIQKILKRDSPLPPLLRPRLGNSACAIGAALIGC